MLDQFNLISLLLLPVLAYLVGAIIIAVIERFMSKAPSCNNGFRPAK